MATALNGVWVQNKAFVKVLLTNWLFQALGHPFFSGPRRLNHQNRTISRDFRACLVIPVKIKAIDVIDRNVGVSMATRWRHATVATGNSI